MDYEWFARGSGIRLPILKFEVEGEEYTTVGPRYKWFATVKAIKPQLKTEQEYTTDIYTQNFTHKITGSNIITRNPMQELFPIGSTLPVFYDPENPRLSYVLRYCQLAWMFRLTFITAAVMLIINVCLQLFL